MSTGPWILSTSCLSAWVALRDTKWIWTSAHGLGSHNWWKPPSSGKPQPACQQSKHLPNWAWLPFLCDVWVPRNRQLRFKPHLWTLQSMGLWPNHWIIPSFSKYKIEIIICLTGLINNNSLSCNIVGGVRGDACQMSRLVSSSPCQC